MKKLSDTRRMLARHHARRRAIEERFEARIAGIEARIDSGEIVISSFAGAYCAAPDAQGSPSSALGVALSGARI